jgi:hypothetical protein
LELDVERVTNLPAEVRAELEMVVLHQKTLEDVVRWGLSRNPPVLIDSVVVQDEFSHDVVIGHPNGFYLAYDTT